MNEQTWKTCYACGTRFEIGSRCRRWRVARLITSFEEGNPFSGGVVVGTHATTGRKALRVDGSYVSMETPQDWTGFDFLKADLFTDAVIPMKMDVEIRDKATRDYWTRVNYSTVVPPGKSTLIIPIKQLYVGEKSRPGRMLILGGITRLVFASATNRPRRCSWTMCVWSVTRHQLA